MADNDKINGLDLAATRAALELVGSQPANARAPKKSRIRWLSGLKFKAQVRNHTFVVDEPSHLAGEDESPNSMEYVLGAYGACLATGFVLNASQRGIVIRNLEVALESTQDNVFTFLGVGGEQEGHPGFDEIRAKLFVQASADPALLEEIWTHTINSSPVHNSLARTVNITPEIEIFS
jgi:uncharacterized OsmC-like protein